MDNVHPFNRRSRERSRDIRTGAALRRCAALLLAVTALMSILPQTVNATASTREQLERAKQEREQQQDQLEGTRDNIDAMNEVRDDLQGQLNNLNGQLTEVSNNLEELERLIAEKEEDITKATEELEDAVRTQDEQYAAMKIRIQFMYERQNNMFLDLLLNAGSFADFLNRNSYFEQLAEYDREKLEEFKATRKHVEEVKAELEQEKRDLDGLKAKAEAEKSRVSGLVSKTSGSISNYSSQISDAEAQALAMEQQIKDKEKDIAVLEAKLQEEIRLSQLAAQSVWRNISEVSFADGDRALLANLIYCEAGNQPYAGQLAVGAVVINRVLSSVYPDSVVGVIYQNAQFSPVASGRLALALAEGRANASCYKAADEAMSGQTNVGGCVYFRTPVEGLNGITIGGHVFY